MKKSQLILVVVGVVAITGLYALPKVVVDNEDSETGISQLGSSSTTETTSAIAQHEAEISPAQAQEITSLKLTISNNSPEKEFVAASEGLGEIYRSLSKYDSAGYFLSLAADKYPAQELSEKTGNVYYEAFGFALDTDKVSFTAAQTRNYLGQVLEKDPNRLDLKTKVAMTYVSSSNPMQGITMLREVLDEEPTNEDGLFNMGILSMQSGQYKRAAERFEELIQYHPTNLQGQFYLGVSYFEANQKNKAKAQFEKVKEMTQDQMILGSIQSYLDKL
jgi:tetratricopeptide (TPR) repeat protein